MKNKVKGYFFDCEGKQIIEHFESEEAGETFAKNHGLEVFCFIKQ